MASRTSKLSTATGGSIPHHCDNLPLLDVLYVNQFEEDTINPADAESTEVNFYKGAPPQWLNFYLSERNSAFIKREGYQELTGQISRQSKSYFSSAIVKLIHESGSGGSTLAMQVLWDLRRKYRCAILNESLGANSTDVANQVMYLFMAGDFQNQNTVLLLLESKTMAQDLMNEIANKKIKAKIPVLIILNCVRKTIAAEIFRSSEMVTLQNHLSDEEKVLFTKKQEDICNRFIQQHTQFHGFKIMCRHFCKDYTKQTCEIVRNIEQRSRNVRLLTFLSLLNSYVPGSYLLLSECKEFLQANSQDFESIMHPFTDLIVTFSGQENDNKRVRMKHPMIAHQCVVVLAEAGMTRVKATTDFLTNFCKADVEQYLVPVIKDLLTKREIAQERLESFSKLILDIKKNEKVCRCEVLLKIAGDKFKENPFIPQALARLYYIEMGDYTNAEQWAIKAINMHSSNSFIADTLGQIHKGNLRKKIYTKHSVDDILKIADKAIAAFKYAENMAEKEVELGSNKFNDRGKFGYMQVAKYIFEALTSHNISWKEILTGKNKTFSPGGEILAQTFKKYMPLIKDLKKEVEKRYRFFEYYMAYSKDKIGNAEPSYVYTDISECYCYYTEREPTSFPGLLLHVDRENIDPDLQWMQKHWSKINAEKRSDVQATQNYILVNIILSQEGVTRQSKTLPLETCQSMLKEYVKKAQINPTTEFNLLALMLFWPESNKIKHNFSYEQTLMLLRECFEKDYSKYIRFRYLVPLFLLGNGDGLCRLIHKTSVDRLILSEPDMANLSQEKQRRKLSELWSSGEIWQLQAIQSRLRRLSGVVENYELFLHDGINKIKVFPDVKASIRNSGPVSFYLGFNIGGPVAFNIKYVTP